MWLDVSTLEDSVEQYDVDINLVTGEYRHRLAFIRPYGLGYFSGYWQQGLPYYRKEKLS